MVDVSRPLRTGLAVAATLAVAAAAAAASALPAQAAGPKAGVRAANPAQWWLTALDVTAAWRAAPSLGKGVTVAVLSTGVDGGHPDLTGVVTSGPDFGKTGRRPGQAFWGDEGTAVAALVAGHGHGPGGTEGITGIAPGARILSVPVTLEYNDPLASDPAVAGRMPAAIAAGIRYAADHGAAVIALPLDPGRMTAVGSAAAEGSQAERSAVAYAVARGALLIAPAGDNGSDAVNYPAAYPGVLAIGATAQNGELAPFTDTGPYVALTAPGAAGPSTVAVGGLAGTPVGLTVAAPGGGYQALASTDMSAALAAGVAALIRGRYPWLTAAEVAAAIRNGATAHDGGSAAAGAGGWGRGALNAGRALARAAAIAEAHPRPVATQAAPVTAPTPSRPAVTAPPASRPAAVATTSAGAGGAVRSALLDLLIAACVLIAGLACALTVTALRRRRRAARAAEAAGGGRARGPGRHSRAQQPEPALPPPPVAIWSRTSPRAIEAGSAWETSRPAAARADDAPLAPWEQAPAIFASGPAPKAPPPWPLSNSGPMYVWNPAATTGPLRPLEEEQDQQP